MSAMLAPVLPPSRSVLTEHTAWRSLQWHTVDCPQLEKATRRQAEAVESLPSFTHSWDIYQHLVSTLQTIQVRVHLTSYRFQHVCTCVCMCMHDGVLKVCMYIYIRISVCNCVCIHYICTYIDVGVCCILIYMYLHTCMYILV